MSDVIFDIFKIHINRKYLLFNHIYNVEVTKCDLNISKKY